MTLSNQPDIDTLHEWDRNHQLHPWAAMDAWRGYDNILVDRAEGIYLTDGKGRKLLLGNFSSYDTPTSSHKINININICIFFLFILIKIYIYKYPPPCT